MTKLILKEIQSVPFEYIAVTLTCLTLWLIPDVVMPIAFGSMILAGIIFGYIDYRNHRNNRHETVP